MRLTDFGPFLVAAVWLDVALPGCQSDAVPPANPPPLQTELLDEITFAIDGQDPATEELVVVPRTTYRLMAGYKRRDDPDARWDAVSLLLVEEDTSEYPGGIRLQHWLGNRENEERGPDGVVRWECRQMDGVAGQNVAFPPAPGRYEIRLCWARYPTTVAEKMAQSEDPHSFMTPFYRAYVTVEPGP